MGVPFFFRWLSTQYPDIVFFDTNLQIDHFYIDANCLIHPVCGERDITTPNLEDIMIRDCIEYFKYIVSVVRPKKLIYLAMDGVAPKAKMQQQRSRRFMSIKQKTWRNQIRKNLGLDIQNYWDTNAITPGTQFMDRLSVELQNYIEKTNYSHFNGLRIIISDSSVPGEGEQKCIRYMKNECKDTTLSHCIYGLDADLIFLTLSTHLPNVYILREALRIDTFVNRPKMSYLSMDKIRESFARQYNVHPEELEYVINDWIGLSCLLGNDFVPHLPSIHIRHKGMEKLLKIYLSLKIRKEDFLLERDRYQLDHRFLGFVLQVLSEQETQDIFDLQYARQKAMQERADRHRMDGSYSDPESLFHKEWDDFVYVADKVEDAVHWDQPEWKRRYYLLHFDTDIEKDPRAVQDFCFSYLRMMHWVINYYFKSFTAWNFAYPYRKAPLTSDLYHFLQSDHSMRKRYTMFEKGSPVTPLQQLLIVLPPESSYLLPASYATLMQSPYSSLKDLYPKEFEMDGVGATFLWEAVPKLPDIDIQRVDWATRKLRLDQNEFSRNRFRKPWIYDKIK